MQLGLKILINVLKSEMKYKGMNKREKTLR